MVVVVEVVVVLSGDGDVGDVGDTGDIGDRGDDIHAPSSVADGLRFLYGLLLAIAGGNGGAADGTGFRGIDILRLVGCVVCCTAAAGVIVAAGLSSSKLNLL